MKRVTRSKSAAVTTSPIKSSRNKINKTKTETEKFTKVINIKRSTKMKTVSTKNSKSGLSDDEHNPCGSIKMFDKMFRNVQHQLVELNDEVKPTKNTQILLKPKKKNYKIEYLDESDHNRELEMNPGSSKREPSKAEIICKEAEDLLKSLDNPYRSQPSGEKMRPRHPRNHDDDEVEVLQDPSFNISFNVNSPSIHKIPRSIQPFNVRIRWKDEILKFKLCETDYCYEIKRLLASEVSLKPDEVMIYFEDMETIFEDKKTLKESNISLGTILEGTRRVNTTVTSEQFISSQNKNLAKSKDPQLIRIKVQSIEKRSEIFFEIGKTSTFRDLQLLYCMKMNLISGQVKFMFDGDLVSLNDTPNDLDLEGDECFDVIVS